MKGNDVAYQYASAQPMAPDGIPWRGYIDGWDALSGIHGWALATEAPSNPVTLELLVGDTVLSVTETYKSRPDLSGLLGVPVLAGFRFMPNISQRLARLNPRRGNSDLNVRVHGSRVLLKGREPLPTVARYVELWREALLAAHVRPVNRASKSDELRVRLSMMRTRSEAFRALPLRPVAENEIGHIDTLFRDAQSVIWFSGWITRDFDTEFPAIILDRQKYPAGVATMRYERQDLASRLVGVVGVIDTSWCPPALGEDVFVYVGSEAGRQLRASARTKVLGAEAFLAVYRQAESVISGGSVSDLSALLAVGDNWLPGIAAAVGMAADASVDSVFTVPGFGCIVEGWSMSPANRVQTFQIKLGDFVLAADDDATYFRPRPDLASLGGSEAALLHAGFVCVLRGELQGVATGPHLLKVVHDDGTSIVKRLDPKLLRELDCMTDSNEVLRMYPSLRQERFYAAFRDAIERHRAARLRWPMSIAMHRCKRMVILTLPREPGNVRLCFDYLARLGAQADLNIGVCLIARRTVNLSLCRLLFDEFRGRLLFSTSLVCAEDEFDGFGALPFVLAKLDVDRFVYVDGGLILTPTGWHHAMRTLSMHGHAIRFFQVVDDSGSPDRVHGELTAACFQWTTAAFLEWFRSARCFVRGIFRDNGLPESTSIGDVFAGSAMRVERAANSRLADMIDEDLLGETNGMRSSD